MTREQRDELAALLPAGRVRFDEPMSLHSAVAAGGPVEAFVMVEDIEELKRVIGWAVERDLDYRFWGKGSALLVRDKGVRGLIVALGSEFSKTWVERASGEEIYVACSAATPIWELLNFCTNEKLTGLEGIACEPGTVGGFLCASSSSTAEGPLSALEEITIVTKDGRELTLRRSAIRVEEGRLKIPRTSAVTRALFKLSRAAEIAEAPRHCPDSGAGLPHLRCVFTSDCRTAASELIEDSGLKGVRVGGARVSMEDANSIVNQGKATARDIAVLMNLMRDRVREQTGVVLVPMIELIGER
ncbi:MAG: FAD-binding protein [bacterium]